MRCGSESLTRHMIRSTMLRMPSARVRSGLFAVLLPVAASCKSAPVQQAKCPEIDMSAEWVRVSRAWSDEQGLQWSNDSLRKVLLTLRDRDQAARADFGARAGDSTYGRQLMRLDS